MKVREARTCDQYAPDMWTVAACRGNQSPQSRTPRQTEQSKLSGPFSRLRSSSESVDLLCRNIDGVEHDARSKQQERKQCQNRRRPRT